jgi:hypothetical protein
VTGFFFKEYLMRLSICLTLAALVGLGAGCGPSGNNTPSGGPRPDRSRTRTDPAALAEGKKYLLPSEPAGSKGVIEVRTGAKDGDEVAVVGQVGGSDRPFTEGRATFLLVDPSLKVSCDCDCPWDFCEYPKKELAAARLSVKFVDPDGKTLRTGAREMFGIEELSTVVVKGKVRRDDKDNVVVIADGLFVRPPSK